MSKEIEKLFEGGLSGGFGYAEKGGRIRGGIVKDGKVVQEYIVPNGKPFKVTSDGVEKIEQETP